MEGDDRSSAPHLEERLDRLERQNRRLRLGAVLLTIGLGALVTTALRNGSPPHSETLRVRAIELLDGGDRPAASIRWHEGELRIEIPPSRMRLARSAKTSSSPDSLGGRTVLRPRSGARLLLAAGQAGPSLLLADGAGHEVAVLGGPTARQAGN